MLVENFQDRSASWDKVLGPSVLVAASIGSLLLNLLIIIGVLRAKSLRTLDSFLALQMALLDLLFSLWCLAWFGTKLADPSRSLSVLAMQIEASVLYTGFFAWLGTSLLLAYHSYLENINRRPSRHIHNILVWLQYLLWLIPAIFCASIGAMGLFDKMPSGSYCGFPYLSDSLSSRIISVGFLASIFVPFLIGAYFYVSILSNKSNQVREVIEAPDPVYLPRGYPFKQPSTLSVNRVKPAFTRASLRQHRAALLSVAYPLMFILSFFPSVLVVLIELATNQQRNSSTDAIVFSISTLYKLMAPALTIRTHSTIRNQVSLLLRISPSPSYSPSSLPSS